MTIIDATLIEAQCKSVWELQCIPHEKKRELAEKKYIIRGGMQKERV